MSGISATLVSVVIDNFNYARYLGEAIDSALRQEGVPVEVIVVDDGSTDNSREVMAGYGDRIVPVFKTNGGQASAVNEGFRHCHGTVVIFLDSDDVLLPTAAARVVAEFASHRNIAKVQYRMRVIDAQGRDAGAIRPSPRIPLQSGDLRRQEVSFPFDLPWAAMSANAFSADVLRQILPIPAEHNHTAADWYLVHVAALFGVVCALDDVCALYRIHGSNQYGRLAETIDLALVRQTIRYAAATRQDLEHFADQLHVARPAAILSVSDIANRLISLKLSPAEHPLAGDSPAGLVGSGIRAANRRFDVKWPLKVMFVAWFLCMGLAPRPMAWRLAEAFTLPDKRWRVNDWLGRLHEKATL